MPLVEAAASAGHRKAMEGNGWSGMVRSQGSSQFAHETLKIPALNQSDSGAADKSATYLRGNIRSDPALAVVQLGHSARASGITVRASPADVHGFGSAGLDPRSGTIARNSGPQLGGAYAGEELPNAAFEIGGGRGQPLGQREDVAYHRQVVAGRVLHSLDILGRPLGIARARLNRLRNLVGSGRLLHHRSGDRGSHRSHVGHGLGHRTDLLDRLARGVLDRSDLPGDLVGRLLGLVRQRLDFGSDHGKAASGVSGA